MEQTSSKKMHLKQWAEHDRPREKLLLNGRRTLSDAELIAILIGSGSKEETAVELSRRILADVGNNLDDLARLSMGDLCDYKGIGTAKAISIMAALELSRRRKTVVDNKKVAITCSEDVYELLKPVYADLGHEEFWILLLNNGNKVIGKEQVSKGGIGMVAVDVKNVFHAVFQMKATSIIKSHNHPSGSLIPSEADKQLTKKIIKAAACLDIRVLDHLIISDEGYYSFLDADEL